MTMAARGLAKLTEECGELMQVVGKKLAYYNDSAEHPDGGPPLSERMEDEMGDVLAAIEFVAQRLGLDEARIEVRARTKLALFQRWDALPENNADGVDAAHASCDGH